MTDEELAAIRGRMDMCAGDGIRYHTHGMEKNARMDMDALLAEIERLRSHIKDMEAIMSALPVDWLHVADVVGNPPKMQPNGGIRRDDEKRPIHFADDDAARAACHRWIIEPRLTDALEEVTCLACRNSKRYKEEAERTLMDRAHN
jgi:hypothetical protein